MTVDILTTASASVMEKFFLFHAKSALLFHDFASYAITKVKRIFTDRKIVLLMQVTVCMFVGVWCMNVHSCSYSSSQIVDLRALPVSTLNTTIQGSAVDQ